MIRKIGSWISTAVVALGLAFMGWLLLPPPPPGPWPSPTPQSREAMAQELAKAASRTHAQEDHQGTYRAVKVLVESFPDTLFAERVAPHMGQIHEASLRQARAKKWSYTELQSSGWGRITQASIASEPNPLDPNAPPTYLVVRAGTHHSYAAVFLVPGVRLPEGCFMPSGCMVQVSIGSEGEINPYRILPEKDQEGWWRFSNYQKMGSALFSPHGVRVFLENSSSKPVIFESQGLDKSRFLSLARSNR